MNCVQIDIYLKSQRLWIDESNYIDGAPLFIYIMAEYQDPTEWIENSHIREISDELHGALFAFEPRYYGYSLPT